MTSRASHYRNKQRHAQRVTPIYQEKPKPIDPDVATSWIPGVLARLTEGQVITLADELGQELGEVKLRELCRRGFLRMEAVRFRGDGTRVPAGSWDPSEFSHFEWTVEEGLRID